jgi:hypothetical protein
MQARKGEVILTADGRHVAAFWACDMELKSGAFTFIPRIPVDSLRVFHGSETPVELYIETLTVYHHASMPDGRSYWRICADAPNEWPNELHWFSAVPCAPGPDPKGMISAYELVSADLKEKGASDYELSRVDYMLGYWRYKAGVR